MGQEAALRRLRRLARALVWDPAAADTLVLDTLASSQRCGGDIRRLFAVMIATFRTRGTIGERTFPKPWHGPTPNIARAFQMLPAEAREVLALIVIEQLDYEDAAQILGLTLDSLVTRLTEARAALARHADGERTVALRLVKSS